MQPLTSWIKVEKWEGVNSRFFWAYATSSQNALITHIALNLLPRIYLTNPNGKNFYVGIVIKSENVQEIEAIFNKHNAADGIAKKTRGENEQECVFFVCPNQDTTCIPQSVQNFLNTVCNPEILGENCVPETIKQQFEKEIQDFLNPPLIKQNGQVFSQQFPLKV